MIKICFLQKSSKRCLCSVFVLHFSSFNHLSPENQTVSFQITLISTLYWLNLSKGLLLPQSDWLTEWHWTSAIQKLAEPSMDNIAYLPSQLLIETTGICWIADESNIRRGECHTFFFSWQILKLQVLFSIKPCSLYSPAALYLRDKSSDEHLIRLCRAVI